jgi:hypothetical protein
MSLREMWTVWCDHKGTNFECHAMDQVSGKKSRAVDEFRKAGWKRTRKGGWMCPKCATLNSRHNAEVSHHADKR